MSPKAQKRWERMKEKLNDKNYTGKLSYDHSHDTVTDEEDTRRRVD